MPHAVFASLHRSNSKHHKPDLHKRDSSISEPVATSPSAPAEAADDNADAISLLLDGSEEDDEIEDPHSDSSLTSSSEDHLTPLSSSPDPSTSYSFDKATIADLVATYGSSSATAWLEFDRYRIWQGASSPAEATPSKPYVAESDFPPVVGYMHTKRYIFPWGDPIVSRPEALEPTARAFVKWAKEQGVKVVWCCVGHEMEEALAKMGWATLQCIHEEVLHPEHVLEVTGWGDDEEDEEEKKERKRRERKERKERKEKEKEEKKHKEEKKEKEERNGSHERESSTERFDKEKLKDLKKNLRRAERAGVHAEEVTGKWTSTEREQVEQGMLDWRRNKGLKGVQLASTTGLPWIDEGHRRYWVARQENQIVGVLILTPIHPPHDSHHPNLGTTPPVSPTSSNFPTSVDRPATPNTPHIKSYLIKNAVSFPSAPRGTSEHLIYTAMAALTAEEQASGIPITVTFGITASDTLKIGHNLGGNSDKDNSSRDANGQITSHGHSSKAGWKITTLSTIYNKVAKGAGLLKRGDFRAKFDTEREGMYVAYEVGPKGEGMGLDGTKALLKVLRK
ncbi:hypothetical protein K435DRAFT_864129 [Dendrothele bispora CBS 962.96]|uniref:Uncharacterized protein n=1 Tax=Dendrothele bispora (strain CBS 962.96) TaxID=1314807 RepID=A0A4S8LP99_DENBC|nr:hypothetical protein K435DRAFT_864129 [Dendrothele bispora CBS 962.96]